MRITITRKQLVDLDACEAGLAAWDRLSDATGADPESWDLTWTRETQIASLACPDWRPWLGWLWRLALLPAWSMRGANLRGADLSDADLYGANLRGASLYGANLRGASLRDADLRDASLRDASLYGADLRDASLRDASLYGADLYGARRRLDYPPISGWTVVDGRLRRGAA